MLRACSNQPPPRYEIQREPGDDMCTVVLYTDVKTDIMTDGDTMYRFDVLCLTVRYTEGILRDVRDNYTEWLEMAVGDVISAKDFLGGTI